MKSESKLFKEKNGKYMETPNVWFKVARQEEDLQNVIEFLAKDLLSRKNDISKDWNKELQKIEIKTTIECGEILCWEVTKKYLAREKEGE